jgi:hypothetical protein
MCEGNVNDGKKRVMDGHIGEPCKANAPSEPFAVSGKKSLPKTDSHIARGGNAADGEGLIGRHPFLNLPGVHDYRKASLQNNRHSELVRREDVVQPIATMIASQSW